IGTDFTVSSDTTISFHVPPAAGVDNIVVNALSLESLDFPSDQNRTKTMVRINGIPTSRYRYVDSQNIQILAGAGLQDGDVVTVDYDLGAFIPSFRVTSLALDPDPSVSEPADNRILYAGTQGAGVFRSVNGGFSWAEINNGLSNFNILSLVALDKDTVYAGTFGGGVFRTFNATDTVPLWCPVNDGLAASVVNTLATDGTRVYAGTALGGIFLLTDGTSGGATDCTGVAATWTAATTNVNASDVLNTFVTDIVIDPTDSTILYAATLGDGTRSIEGNAPEGGVFISTDSGVTWTRIPTLPAGELSLPPDDLPDNRVYSLGISAADPGTVYVGTAGRNVVRLDPTTPTFEVINGTAPNALTNNIFTTGTVLFSGHTQITIIPLADSFQGFGGFGSIFNQGSQNFIYTVTDQNGNPLTAGTLIRAEVSAGSLFGDTTVTIPDVQGGFTVFGLTWTNDTEETKNIAATLSITVTSPENGDATALISRTLIKPVTITPSSGEVPADGGNFNFTVTGGSDTSYTVVSDDGSLNTVAFVGQTVTLTVGANPLTEERTITITATDRITGSQAFATVTQAAPE
ncbi:MAG: hypothetical protein D6736_16255, partial [Nitrospinota bacterium]